MPDTNEWLFDIIWELSDKSYEAGLPDLAAKLEEAMDTYLFEYQLASSKVAVFKSSRTKRASLRERAEARMNERAERRRSLKMVREKVRSAQKPETKCRPVGPRSAMQLARS